MMYSFICALADLFGFVEGFSCDRQYCPKPQVYGLWLFSTREETSLTFEVFDRRNTRRLIFITFLCRHYDRQSAEL